MSFRQIAKRKRSQICQCLRPFSTSTIHRQEESKSSEQNILNILKAGVEARKPQPSKSSATHSLFEAFSSNLTAPSQRPVRSIESEIAAAQTGQTRRDLLRQSPRRWSSGQIYAPHDLSPVEATKYSVIRRKPTRDVFDLLDTNPIKHYKNFALLSQFVSETGRIKHSNETGLRPVNQRRLAKAIRRAVGLGLMPSVYKHPEVLGREIGLNRDTGLGRGDGGRR